MFVWLDSDFREQIQRVLQYNSLTIYLYHLTCVKSVTSDRTGSMLTKYKVRLTISLIND